MMMRRRYRVPVLFSLLFLFLFPSLFSRSRDTIPPADTTEILIGTFRGNDQRNFYGQEAPANLSVVWKLYLGKGRTVISRHLGERIWAGAGWTGQPLLVREQGQLFLIQGAYDHHLKKIEASSGRLIWQYLFDDVVKGTGTIWRNPHPRTPEEAFLILQGSRLGTQHYMDAPHIPSYRAISLLTGRELWRLDSKWTDSYSRDVDGSALIVNDTVYIGLENSLFTLLDPDPAHATLRDSMLQPRILKELRIYHRQDVIAHKYNVVTESSPARLGRAIFITSGSGHVFRYNMDRQVLDWDFYIGSDMDGSPVVTRDSCILVSVEKQYIPGPGGIYKLDPRRPPQQAVVWYFPTLNDNVGSWEGGVIGTAAINDQAPLPGQPPLAAFAGIDGYLYLVRHDSLMPDTLVAGPDSVTRYPVPVLLDRYRIGPSISSPLITGDKLIAASYNGLFLFRIIPDGGSPHLQLLDRFIAPFEATPIVWEGHIYLASRNGFLYCFGKQ